MSDSRKYFLYIHKNKINGKAYVGITCKKNPTHRWRNGNGYSEQPFYHAIQKYGWDNFEHEIVEENLSEEDAKIKEIQLISKLNSIIPNGYNYTSGGDTNWKHSVKVFCYETNEIFNSVEEAYISNLNLFKMEYYDNIIKDCCNHKIPYIKMKNTNKKYHYQYLTKNMLKDTIDVEEKCINETRYKYNRNISIYSVCGKRKLRLDENRKYKVAYVENVCTNCGDIYRESKRCNSKGTCKKCKELKINILKEQIR